MEPESLPELSAKTRAILFHFKADLKSENLLLDTHISNIFKYRKEKFTRKDFHKLIRKYDKNLVLAEIDSAFDELNHMGKHSVSYEILSNIMDDINEYDDPVYNLDRRSLVLKSKKEVQEHNALIEFKEMLLKNDDYLETIEFFMNEKDGFLNKLNVIELLSNLLITNNSKVETILDCLFEDKDKIELKELLEKLGLADDGTRIRLEDYSLEESIILENQKSEFIQNSQKSKIKLETNISFSKILNEINDMDDNDNSGFYAIQKIPLSLRNYFNYGSELDEPFASLATHYIESNTVFIDDEGPTYSKARKWVHISEVRPNYFLFQAAESVLLRSDRKGLGKLLEPKDIVQGRYGNCYFLSAVAAIVEYYPELVYRLFVFEKNPSHLFGVRLFVDGIWKTVSLDGCFPLNEKGKFCGAQPHHDEIWVMLLEKAWAKLFKTYESIHSGYNEEGLVAVTGAPTIIVLSKEEGFLSKIQEEFKKGSIITCTTSKAVSEMSEAQQEKLGVFAGHAYTILRIEEIQTENAKTTLIKMKNPWGTKAWKGEWSFSCPKWTKQLRSALHYTIDSLDGTFFISLEDFVKYFDHINISKLNIGFRNCNITNQANRYDFYQNSLKITHSGTYFFTIYQENGRKYKNASGVYQKSPSWLFLAKINSLDDKIVAIKASASGYQHTTVEAHLEPGDYVILSKVSWNYWEEHPYVISSYGPGKVFFEECEICPIKMLYDFIESRSKQIIESSISTKSFYKETKIWKSFYFDHTEGLGFITVCNEDYKILETTLTLDPCKGIEIMLPFTNPIKINAEPHQQVTAVCVVDPQGYSYKLMEGYKLHILKSQ